MLDEKIEAAFASLGLSGLGTLTRSNRPDIADFQCNGAFAAAKQLKESPRVIADRIRALIEDDPAFTVEVAGAGFLNVRLTDEYLAEHVTRLEERQENDSLVYIDFGGPNIAKPMHVGHLRSLVIGDALRNIGRFLGHTVIGDIHLGDWGFQMGLLIASHAETVGTVEELEQLYVEASTKAKTDEEFRSRAHLATRMMQEGLCNDAFSKIVDLSLASIKSDLVALGVTFDQWNGESDTALCLQTITERLGDILVESDGAIIASGLGDPPLIWKNSQGCYLYGATDVATIAMRDALAPDLILYVVDQRQELHFQQVFALANKGAITHAKLEHVGFGTVNGPDGKPFRTREGGVPRLSGLIWDAFVAASTKTADHHTAVRVALAAIKFGDLITKRSSGYAFDLDRALAHEGKTGPYLLYQLVRIKSIMSKALIEPGTIAITSPMQRDLAFAVMGFDGAVEIAWEMRMPHHLAEYLYDLCQKFSSFYAVEHVADSPSNLALVAETARRIELGLTLLGIQTVESM